VDIVRSKNDIPIRLPNERWLHITEEHSEMAGYYFEVLETVESPEVIYQGYTGEYIALREIETGKFIVVIYREMNKEDGFIITAYLTKRKNQFGNRIKLWSQ
jgi:hypothetical protein